MTGRLGAEIYYKLRVQRIISMIAVRLSEALGQKAELPPA